MKQLCAAVTAIATLLSSQATALSCLPPDVATSFNQAADAEELYVILLGSFTFGEVPLNDTGDLNFPREVGVDAQFVGSYLTGSGFVEAPSLDVRLEFTCLAAWCGSLTSDGREILAFVEQRPDSFVLSVDPCYSTTILDPSVEQLDQVETCMTGGPCNPPF